MFNLCSTSDRMRTTRSVDRDEPQLSKVYGLSNKHMYDFVRQIKEYEQPRHRHNRDERPPPRQETGKPDELRSEDQRKHKANMNK